MPIAKEYPRPTLEQLNQLGEMGELGYTKLNELGYPSVMAVNTGVGVLPWWVVLGVELPLSTARPLFVQRHLNHFLT